MRQHKEFKKNSVYTFLLHEGTRSVNKLCVLSDKNYACLVDIKSVDAGIVSKKDKTGYTINDDSAILLKKNIAENKGIEVYYYGWVSGDGEEYIDASTM